MSADIIQRCVPTSRHVVPAPCGVWRLHAPHPSVARYRLPLSTNQRGPKVGLATGDFGHDRQQVMLNLCFIHADDHELLTVCRLPSSVGGLILDKTVSNPNFEGMAVFTPVINGGWKINTLTAYHYIYKPQI